MAQSTIAVASGKGGTGKTTVAVNLARVMGKVKFLDCDVEEPNAHLFLRPEIVERIPVCSPIPKVDESLCTYCGECARVCAYHAILVGNNVALTFPELCHGCGGCALFCPTGAISEVDRDVGVVEIGEAREIEFVQGILNVKEPMAGPVIRAVKKYLSADKVNIIDCPPGTSCPMVEAIRDVDFLVLVTESTPFGLHDLRLAVATARLLKLPFGVIINRAGIGNSEIYDYLLSEKIEVLAEIPDDREVAGTYSRGGILVDENKDYRLIFEQLTDRLENFKIMS